MTSTEVAVIAGRRRFSAEQKRQFLAEAEASSMAAVATRHGIARSLLQKWKEAQRDGESSFVRLLPEKSPEGEVTRPSCSVFVHLDGAIVLELPASVSPIDLATLVRALRA